ncbi:MAG TPA: hypothetical protein VGQ64_02775 [Candidatus Limnocylindrales bacterium]|jgi:hypothetical protein|nr:hypothetical protein [Candidatus Limnocylindrales bacterium]
MTKLIYIHGAGEQENRLMLKRRLDGALFEQNMLERTVLGYYSDLLHGEEDVPAAIEAAAADPELAELDAAFLTRAGEIAEEEAAAGEGAPPKVEGVTLPDPAFFLLANIASSDVKVYLKGGKGPEIRDRVIGLFPMGEPVIVVSHSLGTIVAYDVLASFKGSREIPLWVTLGSPLGIGNVQKRLNGGESKPPVPVPAGVAAWHNYADPHDVVALEQTLSDEFSPLGFVKDATVENEAFLNHDLTGYLHVDAVRTVIRTSFG